MLFLVISDLNSPIEREVKGDLNMFLYSKNRSTVYNLNVPLSPLIVNNG